MLVSTVLRLAASALFAVLVVGAAQADTPRWLPGAQVVSADDVAQARAAGVMVIDTRVAASYAEGHIKGAINIPYRERSAKEIAFDPRNDEFGLSQLPDDKSTPLVMYCDGPACWESFKAAIAAIRCGYRHVLWYRGGFSDWKARGEPTE